MKALHGGTAKHDTIDAHKLAVLRRGGLWPHADVPPAARRATRDLRRRRRPRMRQRAERLTPGQHTHGQDHLPDIGNKLAYQANRAGVAERVPAPAVPKSLAVALALIASSGQLRRDLELALGTMATQPEATTLSLLQPLPGVGQSLRLVRLSERHDLARCPRVQAFVSSGRVVTCAKAAAGERSGTSGTKSGHASLPWAFAEAAVLCLRHTPAGQQDLARLEKPHGQGKALTVLAPQLARAV
jgi:Transposase IS116/IS110/IS902 family